MGLSNKAIEGHLSDAAEEKQLNDDQDGETHWEEAAFVANPTSLNGLFVNGNFYTFPLFCFGWINYNFCDIC